MKKYITTLTNIKSINIESDSHGRGLAGLIGEQIGPVTKVSGTVRPGANLKNVASYPHPAPGSSVVLIAGTNDVAVGEHHNISRYLERHILDKPSSSKLVVATLPYRHDLPYEHPIHRETDYVNSHIKYLAAKYKHKGVGVLDFNSIPRHLFTNHGMHLRLPGKRLLARRVVESVKTLDKVASPPSMPLSLQQPSTAQLPIVSAATVAAGLESAGCADVTSSLCPVVPGALLSMWTLLAFQLTHLLTP